MRLPLEYGVYNRVTFTHPFNKETYQEIIEYEFPTEYDPDMSFTTKSQIHNKFMYILFSESAGWLENVYVGQLRDEELKQQYIAHYSKTGLSIDYILTRCPAQQVNIDALPRSLNYIPNKPYEYNMNIVQDFYYYYYNRGCQIKFGIERILPIYLPKEPFHHFHDIIQERMDKSNPQPRRRKR